MNESFHDYEKKDETVRAMEGLTGLKEAPKNVSQLQMLLIEEYFLSQPGNQSISPEEFSITLIFFR